ncbi:MAG: hypothetical protein ACI86P_001261, partial [Flavobacteriales bacterium]
MPAKGVNVASNIWTAKSTLTARMVKNCPSSSSYKATLIIKKSP